VDVELTLSIVDLIKGIVLEEVREASVLTLDVFGETIMFLARVDGPMASALIESEDQVVDGKILLRWLTENLQERLMDNGETLVFRHIPTQRRVSHPYTLSYSFFHPPLFSRF